MPEAAAALASNDFVEVDTDLWLTFSPVETQNPVGVIFYPGGNVSPKSYAPYAQDLAKAGYPTIIVPMPFDLAFFGSDRAEEVIDAFPDIEIWVLAGHSLGGVAAARFITQNPDTIDGLALWASIPARADSLADFDLPTISIYGALDGFVRADRVEATRDWLPAETELIRIEGGNHAQFGWYGPQGDEPAATISREEQQEIVVEAMLDFLYSLEP